MYVGYNLATLKYHHIFLPPYPLAQMKDLNLHNTFAIVTLEYFDILFLKAIALVPYVPKLLQLTNNLSLLHILWTVQFVNMLEELPSSILKNLHCLLIFIYILAHRLRSKLQINIVSQLLNLCSD